MLEFLPSYISIIFGITTFATLILFIWVIKNSSLEGFRNKANVICLLLIIWLLIQAVLSLKNFYNTDINSFPPKIMLIGIFPAITAIITLFATSKGRKFIDSLPLKNLTYLHIVRVPVEIVLFWLFLHKAVPELMTFEGRNFDILAGITAPFVVCFGFTKNKIRRKLLLCWNFIALILLLNIVINALFSTPSPIQKFAFDQPNIAILNFPFVWLPTFIVPVILFGHLVSIRKLLKSG